jgi:S-DNA-T family DNA segregation ATPase FtsK/SpoIIIE
MLKDTSNKAKSLKPKQNIEQIKPDEVMEITPIISAKESIPKIEKDNSTDSKAPELNVTASEGSFAKDDFVQSSEMLNRRNNTSSKFFKSKDLIGCISANVNHVQTKGPDESYFQTIIRAIEEKLGEFKLDGKIINILKGPVVDTFELELGSGVKVSKVQGLSDDIGLALNGAPIRIVYPMRGKSTIGIEVPRNPRDFIFLDEVLQSDAFNDANQRLPIAMGKDAFGDVKVVDLAAMPHMLVAGATGAGKSVFINSLLVSLIVKKSPRELRLILIDPKQLELAMFADLPHWMLPVITDPTSSAVALLWAVQEMDKRYTILKEMGVKNIEGFNKKVKICDPKILFKINEYYEDKEEPGYELPYIVVVIDEFADLILSKAGKEIETNVNRLAAKARAAGIHLVVATQRPSTDVVTGVVKANFPTRVAFRVSTGHDSKTILDQYGAEKLLGKGDMLYKHGVDLLRMHSSFVEENEVEGLIEKLATITQNFDDQAIDFLENGGDSLEDEDEMIKGGSYTSGTSSDPVYQQALEVVMENGNASASMLQRRLRVGYNRAANLVEEMERNGIVGPAQGSKPRKVLARSE